MKIIFGILAIALGVVIVIKSDWFVENFGTIAWAEEHLGTSGGSRLMWKLIGLAFIIVSLMIMTNLLQMIVLGFFGPMLGGAK